MSRTAMVLLAVLAVVLLACGRSHGARSGEGPDAGRGEGPDAGSVGPDGSVDDELDAADVAAALEAYQCEFSLRCSTYPIPAFHPSCHPEVAASRVQWHRDHPRPIDQERAAACLASLEEETCSGYRPECDGVLQGDRVEGEPCEFAVDCARGFYCSGAADGCSGTCVPQLGPGEECGLEVGACVSGDCRLEGERGTCSDFARIGERCEEFLSCESGYCDAEGICRSDRDSTGTPCERDRDCSFLHSCSARGTCELVEVQRPGLGDACNTDEECLETFGCREGLCVPYPVEGEACGDLPCLWSGCIDGVCAPVPAGGGCRDDLDCASGWCGGSPAAGVCQAPTPIGGACRRDVECGESGWCAEGVCAARGMCE